jgi:hypothetical protein
VELLLHLGLPLLGQVRRAEDDQSLAFAAIEQFSRQEQRLNGLSDTDVVCYQEAHGINLQPHQQWNELVGARFDCDATERSEWPGTGSKSEAQGITEQSTGAMIAG